MRSSHPLPSFSALSAAIAAASFSASSARNRDGVIPFCARNWRLKFEMLLKPDEKQTSVIRMPAVAHQQLAGQVDAQPVDVLHQRQPGVPAEAAREGRRG